MRFVLALALLAVPSAAQLDFELTVHELGAEPFALDLADFDGNGLSDLVFAHESADQVSLVLQQPGQVFDAPVFVDVGDHPMKVVAGDLDSDGSVDLAVLHGGGLQQISILLGTGPTAFTPGAALSTAGDPEAMQGGDLDSDGHLDLVVACGDSEVLQTFAGLGDGTFAAPVSIDLGTKLISLALADPSGDGQLDAAAGSYLGTTYLFEGGPSGALTEVDFHSTGLDYVSGMDFGDYDGDGMQDLVTAGLYYNKFSGGDLENDVSFNHGFPTFFFGQILFGSDGLDVMDMDGNGLDDVVTHDDPEDRLEINHWSSNYAPNEAFHDLGSVESPQRALDLDGDGMPDVATACRGKEGRFTVHWQRLPLPPTIAATTPAKLPSLVPDGTGFLLYGEGFSGTIHVQLGTTPLKLNDPGAMNTAEIVDDGTLRLYPAPATVLGPITVQVSSAFGTDSKSLSIAAPGRPFLNAFDADDFVKWSSFPSLYAGGDPGDLVFVAASLKLQPTVLPGILAADIGDQGTSLVMIHSFTAAEPGWIPIPITLPGPVAATFHFQAAAIDAVTLELPFETGNVVSLTVF